MSLGNDLCHFDIALGLEITIFMISSTLIVYFDSRHKVEAAETKHIYTHKEAKIDINGNNYNQHVVEQMAVLCNKVNHRPPVHIFIDYKGLGEPDVFMFVNQVLKMVCSLFFDRGSRKRP